MQKPVSRRHGDPGALAQPLDLVPRCHADRAEEYVCAECPVRALDAPFVRQDEWHIGRRSGLDELVFRVARCPDGKGDDERVVALQRLLQGLGVVVRHLGDSYALG